MIGTCGRTAGASLVHYLLSLHMQPWWLQSGGLTAAPCLQARGAQLQAWFRAVERSAGVDEVVSEQLQAQAGEACGVFARLTAELVAQVGQRLGAVCAASRHACVAYLHAAHVA